MESEKKSLLLWRDEYGPDDLKRISSLGKAEKQRLAAEILFRGGTQEEAAKILGLSRGIIAGGLRDETEEMRQAMKEAMGRAALKRIPEVFETLSALLVSDNEETRRKAVADIARIAQMPIDAATSATFNVTGTNIQLNAMPMGELDKKIGELSRLLGPEAKKLAESEGVHVGRSPAAKPAKS